jgi:hypothetical protein
VRGICRYSSANASLKFAYFTSLLKSLPLEVCKECDSIPAEKL